MTAAQDRRQRNDAGGSEPFVILTVGLDHRAIESIRRYCSIRHWICDRVRGGREALGYLRMTSDRPPAMILCADALPDGSWLQLLEWAQCRLVVVSRVADERLWTKALNLGACDLLSNPFTRTELEWAINSARLAWERDRAARRKRPLALAAGD